MARTSQSVKIEINVCLGVGERSNGEWPVMGIVFLFRMTKIFYKEINGDGGTTTELYNLRVNFRIYESCLNNSVTEKIVTYSKI